MREGGVIRSTQKLPLAERVLEIGDGIREVVLSRGLVDTKVCAIDDDWSGLLLTRRRS